MNAHGRRKRVRSTIFTTRILAWDPFRDYPSRHPDAAVAYRRRGVTVEVARAGDVPGLAVTLPEWRRRLLLHRPVDALGPERCPTLFGPAN